MTKTNSAEQARILSKRIANLPDKQREVVTLVAQGYDTDAICDKMGVTENTIKNHMNKIFKSLHIETFGEYNPRVRIAYLIGRYMRGLNTGTNRKGIAIVDIADIKLVVDDFNPAGCTDAYAAMIDRFVDILDEDYL